MAESEKPWVARDRAEYEADEFKWLSERFRKVSTHFDFDWQTDHLKWFVHSASEALLRELNRLRDSLILWLGAIAIVALASAGFWIGSAAVAVILILNWRLSLRRDRMLWRFDRFREEFSKLCAEHISDRGDKEFLQEVRHRIEFPLTAKEEVSADDLRKIETLDIEYCQHSNHVHGGFDADPADRERWKSSVREATLKCELCAAVDRVREHIEGVLSRFEKEIETARAALISKVDGSDLKPTIFAKPFLEEFRKWEDERAWPDPARSAEDQTLLKSLREKDHWTFEQTDKMRELARGYDWRSRAHGKPLFEVLTREMESVAKLCDADDLQTRQVLEELWQFYESGKGWLNGHQGMLKNLQCTLGRRHPEATIRELGPPVTGWAGWAAALTRLGNFGFDPHFVRQQLEAAWKAVAKEEKKSYRILREDEFSAARDFFEVKKAHDARGVPPLWKK